MVLLLPIRLWARRINITTRIVYNKGFLEGIDKWFCHYQFVCGRVG